jgi:hypothetical protein
MRRLIVLPALLLLAIGAVGGAAWACRCKPPPPPKEALKNAAAVFAGKVSAKKAGGEVVVTFDVSKAWKGVDAKTITVRTPRDSAACGFTFEMEKSYLIYAHRDSEGAEAKLSTNICTRTKLLSEAKDDLIELGEGKVP